MLFRSKFPAVSGSPGLPCADITTVDSQAVSLDVNVDTRSYGYAVSNVKGSSVAVRALWNPEFFQLGTNSATNIQSVDKWARGWRKALNETYLEQGDLQK